jgi:hypothetical protein
MRKEDCAYTTFLKLWALTVIPVQDDLYIRTSKAERSPALDKRDLDMPTQLFFAFSPSKFDLPAVMKTLKFLALFSTEFFVTFHTHHLQGRH